MLYTRCTPSFTYRALLGPGNCTLTHRGHDNATMVSTRKRQTFSAARRTVISKGSQTTEIRKAKIEMRLTEVNPFTTLKNERQRIRSKDIRTALLRQRDMCSTREVIQTDFSDCSETVSVSRVVSCLY